MTADPSVEALLDEQDIIDVIQRCSRASDRGDLELMKSAFHPDGTISYHPEFTGNAWQAHGRRYAEPDYLDSVGIGDPRDNRRVASHHQLSNHRIELAGDVAMAETYFLGYHVTDKPEGLFLSTVAGRYIDRLERRDGQWRILARQAVHDWNQVKRIDHPMPTVQLWRAGTTDRSDPSYWQLGNEMETQ